MRVKRQNNQSVPEKRQQAQGDQANREERLLASCPRRSWAGRVSTIHGGTEFSNSCTLSIFCFNIFSTYGFLDVDHQMMYFLFLLLFHEFNKTCENEEQYIDEKKRI